MASRFPFNILDNKTVPFICRILLGGLFVYASITKILYPGGFSESIGNYQMMPHALTNMVAIVLPWVELVAGLMLLNGLKTQSSNFVIFLLIGIFTIGIIQALARGLDINCGCFSEEGRRVGVLSLVEEFVMFAMCLIIFFFDKKFFSLDAFFKKIRMASTTERA
ncbi:MauE/DoxX family redox-associated membrane protein [Acidobacteriota bacterium]